MIAPVTLFELPDDHRGPPKISILGFTIVRLEPAVIRDTMLAALTARHFHGDDSEVDYRVAVVQRDDHSKLVWESEPGIANAVTVGAGCLADVHGAAARIRCSSSRAACAAIRGQSPPPPPPPPAPLAGIREPGSGTGETSNSGSRIPDPGSR